MQLLKSLIYKGSARDLIIEEAKLRRFMENGVRPMLEALYPAPDWISSAENETIICRCEEVLADLEKSLQTAARAQIKQRRF